MRNNVIISILSFIVILGLLSFIFTYDGVATSRLSFDYFLQLLDGYEPMIFNNTLSSIAIDGSWGVFDFLRVFFNFFLQGFNILVYLASNLINVIQFLLYFIVGIFYV